MIEFYFSGFGTTHKVNNLIIQGHFRDSNQSLETSATKQKRSRRSFIPNIRDEEDAYHHCKRVGPTQFSFPVHEASDLIFDECNKRHFIWALLRFRTIHKVIPSWTGFQIIMCNKTPILKSSVGYLDCINASATEMSTIYQVKSIKRFLVICDGCLRTQKAYTFYLDTKYNVPRVQTNVWKSTSFFQVFKAFLKFA